MKSDAQKAIKRVRAELKVSTEEAKKIQLRMKLQELKKALQKEKITLGSPL